jgi:hypothetical protein
VLGTQQTFCIVIVGLLERDSFDLLLPEFDKPWVNHLRETCCCSINLCTWRPNTVYKNRSVHRHQFSLTGFKPELAKIQVLAYKIKGAQQKAQGGFKETHTAIARMPIQ